MPGGNGSFVLIFILFVVRELQYGLDSVGLKLTL